jgi:membrane protein DedA with SNARE-associated domain
MSQAEILRLIATYGYWIIAVGVTVDSFGVPVPGEIMLLSAGMYAGATHRLSFPLVVGAAAAGAVVGDNSSYALGRLGGTRLLERYGHIVRFGRQRQRVLRYLLDRYGRHVVLGGRFVPVVHIGAAFLAGSEKMRWPRFALFNGLACLLWSAALAGAGYLCGKAVLKVGDVVAAASIPLALVIIVVAGVAFHLLEGRLERQMERDGRQDAA